MSLEKSINKSTRENSEIMPVYNQVESIGDCVAEVRKTHLEKQDDVLLETYHYMFSLMTYMASVSHGRLDLKS